MPAKRMATPPNSETINNSEQHIKPPSIRLYKVPSTTKGIQAAKRTGHGHVNPHDSAISANHVNLAQQDDTVDTDHTCATRQHINALHELSCLGDPPNDVDMLDLYDPDLCHALTTDLRGNTEINPTPSAPHQLQQTHTPNMHLQELTSVASKAPKTPNSYKDTLTSPDAARWQKAMQDEFKVLMHNGTYILVPFPQGCKPISAQWLYKVKLHADSSIDCYKARWVAKGFTQRFSIDYNSTFSPVIWIKNLWLLLAFMNTHNLKIHQVNINTVFLHTKLTEEIYISQPKGFVNKQQPHHIGQLLKSLYRLKQVLLEWNCTIITHKSKLRGIKQIIADGFPIKDLGEATSILRIKIQCNQPLSKLYIQQCGKINNILATFGLTNSKPVSTPMLPNLQLPTSVNQHDNFEYHSTIGMLSYLAHASQPDILFPVTYLSWFATNYGPQHIVAVKRIMHYLTRTANLAICYLCTLYNNKDAATHVPIGYCNADWGNIKVDHHSVSSIIFIFCSRAILWSVKTQKCVALSLTKAELNAISEATCQALYVCKHLPSLGVNPQQPLLLFNNNQSTLAVVDMLSSTYHSWMKHYDIKLAHLHDTTTRGQVHFRYCCTNNMPADVLTKALG